jgi:hypothetical protein
MSAYELSADDAADRAAEWVMMYGVDTAATMVGLTESNSVRVALIRECRSWAIAQGMAPFHGTVRLI